MKTHDNIENQSIIYIGEQCLTSKVQKQDTGIPPECKGQYWMALDLVLQLENLQWPEQSVCNTC